MKIPISEQYQKTRRYTEKICAPLHIEDFVIQAAEFTSPAKWQLAHTTWFFESFILEKLDKDYQIFHTNFSYLFNSYYNNSGERVERAKRGLLNRPSTEDIFKYRKYVDKAILRLLKTECSTNLIYLVQLGINHEQQHQELLLTDIKYMFAQHPLQPAYDINTTLLNNEENQSSGFIKINEGIYEIGYQKDEFCYDNELGVHKVYIHDFEISKSLVTNEEYLAFIESGAYSNFNLWLDEGWKWVQETQAKAPLYWQKNGNKWQQFTLRGVEDIKPNHILKHINFYEAMAFATWKEMRLATEFEWEVASNHFNWGQRWEWTNSAYLPYPYYKKEKGAIGEYNGKFMVNQMVLRGASIATTPMHSRNTYRNFFKPQEQWQFTGIRLVK